jgi:hypothetical protein
VNGGGEGRGGEGRGRDKNSSGKVWADMTIYGLFSLQV